MEPITETTETVVNHRFYRKRRTVALDSSLYGKIEKRSKRRRRSVLSGSSTEEVCPDEAASRHSSNSLAMVADLPSGATLYSTNGHSIKKCRTDVEGLDQVLSRRAVSWNQTDEEVHVTIGLLRDEQDLDVDVILLEKKLLLTVNGSHRWSCQLDNEVKGKVKLSRPNSSNEVVAMLAKQVAGQVWTSLGEKQDEVACSSKDADCNLAYKQVTFVNNDFYDQDTFFVYTAYIADLCKEMVHVTFNCDSFSFTFLTRCKKFLEMHPPATSRTVFYHRIKTKYSYDYAGSSFSTTSKKIEVKLRKLNSIRWTSVEAPTAASEESTPVVNGWRPLKQGASMSARIGRPLESGSGDCALLDTRQAESSNREARYVAATDRLYDSDSSGAAASSPKPVRDSDSGEDWLGLGLALPPTPAPLHRFTGVSRQGFTGLDNLGNTCFMNAVLQVLANSVEFCEFFLSGCFKKDINEKNPLGTGGLLALAFADLLHNLWKGDQSSYAPSALKNLIARKASQFTGFAQHDAQEFLAFLLDGLHEDLNRVKHKPYTSSIDGDGKSDEELAEEAWETYKKRNDSMIVDTFQGQYKSKLVCPSCGKTSITFDPYMYLSVPVPKNKVFVPVYFTRRVPVSRPVKYMLALPAGFTADTMLQAVAEKTGVPPTSLRLFETQDQGSLKVYCGNMPVPWTSADHMLFVTEVLTEESAGEDIVELRVTQCIVKPSDAVISCSICKTEGADLVYCCKCFRVGYCSRHSLKQHWDDHTLSCEKEQIGLPFIISLPRSRTTYRCIARTMEKHAQYSVEVYEKLPSKSAVSNRRKEPLPTNSLTEHGESSQSSMEDTSIPAYGRHAAETLRHDAPGPSPAEQADADALEGEGGLHEAECSTKDLPASLDCSVEDDKPLRDGMQRFGGSTCAAGGHSPARPENAQALQAPGDDSSPVVIAPAAAGFISPLSHQPSRDKREGCASPRLLRAPDTSSSSKNEELLLTASECATSGTPSGRGKTPTRAVLGGVEASSDHAQRKTFPFGIKAKGGRRYKDEGDKRVTLLLSPQDLVMEWNNDDRSPDYVLLQSKDLEYEEDPSCSASLEADIKLEHCLQLFTEPERLTAEEAWYCPRCKEHREACKQMSLWRLPEMLIIHLKRFSFSTYAWRDKMEEMVEYPIRGLDLGPFYVGPTLAIPPLYDLFGVVNHRGKLLNGHYTACARFVVDGASTKVARGEFGWRLFDDSRVSSMSEKDVVTPYAYVLFYRRRKAPSVSPPLPLAGEHVSGLGNRKQHSQGASLLGPAVNFDADDDQDDAADVRPAIGRRQGGSGDDGVSSNGKWTDMDSPD